MAVGYPVHFPRPVICTSFGFDLLDCIVRILCPFLCVVGKAAFYIYCGAVQLKNMPSAIDRGGTSAVGCTKTSANRANIGGYQLCQYMNIRTEEQENLQQCSGNIEYNSTDSSHQSSSHQINLSKTSSLRFISKREGRVVICNYYAPAITYRYPRRRHRFRCGTSASAYNRRAVPGMRKNPAVS
jgi:hypothetical protein